MHEGFYVLRPMYEDKRVNIKNKDMPDCEFYVGWHILILYNVFIGAGGFCLQMYVPAVCSVRDVPLSAVGQVGRADVRRRVV